MTVKTINYQKVFPLGMYVNERIGVEIQIDPSDSPEEALAHAKSMVQRFHEQSNPQISYQEEVIQEIQVQPKDGWANLVDAMATCTEINGSTGLKSFEKLVELNKEKHPELQTAYDNQLKKLNNARNNIRGYRNIPRNKNRT